MDFLNKSIAQLSELFRSMTPGARLTAGLLLAVVVVSVGYLFREGTTGPDAYLFGGTPLSDGQLTRIEAAIAKAGLSGAVREGNRIRVPSGQQSKYVAAVADGDALPPNYNTILEDAVGKTGPWETTVQAKARIKIAKEQTLSEIVRSMYWVESAVVLYDEHETRGLREIGTQKQATASVSVKPISGETLTPARAKNIQKLVAHAVTMQASDVAITNLGEGGAFGSDGDVTADIFEDGSLMQTKVAFEQQKRDSIMKALGDIPGVRVQVNADFNDTVEQKTRSVKPDKNATTPSHTSTSTQSSKQQTTRSGGPPGLEAQGPNRRPAAEPAQQNSDETKSSVEETDNVVSISEESTLRKGYTPKEVWATVAVPTAYVENLWKARNPQATAPPKPDDLRVVQNDVQPKVENIVEPLLLLQANKLENTYKHVKVVFVDTLPAAPIVGPSMASTATSWFGQYWSTLAMLGVAMFSLLVLRSVVNDKPAAGAVSTPLAALTLYGDENRGPGKAAGGGAAAAGNAAVPAESSAPESAEPRPKLKLKKSGSSLKDDLVEIVKEDPEAAADILRSWISKAG